MKGEVFKTQIVDTPNEQAREAVKGETMGFYYLRPCIR